MTPTTFEERRHVFVLDALGKPLLPAGVQGERRVNYVSRVMDPLPVRPDEPLAAASLRRTSHRVLFYVIAALCLALEGIILRAQHASQPVIAQAADSPERATYRWDGFHRVEPVITTQNG